MYVCIGIYIYVCVYIYLYKWSSWPRDQTLVSCIAVRFFIVWATRKPMYQCTCVYICVYVYIYISPCGTTQIKLYIISNNTEGLFMFLYGPASTHDPRSNYYPIFMTFWISLKC